MPPRKHIYPVFLPHAGCPFQCVYCNQFAVTSAPESAGDVVESALFQVSLHAETAKKSGRHGEVAFYGGTFTSLPGAQLLRILERAAVLKREGAFTGIRFSTRPDCMSEEICEILSAFPVTTVELGVQSLSDRVLEASGRGYAPETAIEAADTVRHHGWDLGIQLMAGLPAETDEIFLDSVKRVVDIRPDFVRIYPTVVLNGSPLARLYLEGAYKPLSLDRAIELLVPAFDLLTREGVPIVRMGLHADAALEKPGAVLAGPLHPAFGYLVRSRWWRDRVGRALLEKAGQGRDFIIYFAANQLSEAIGPGRCNLSHWKSVFGLDSIRVEAAPGLAGTEMILERSSYDG